MINDHHYFIMMMIVIWPLFGKRNNFVINNKNFHTNINNKYLITQCAPNQSIHLTTSQFNYYYYHYLLFPQQIINFQQL